MDEKLVLVTDNAPFMRKVIRNTLDEMELPNAILASDGDEAVDLFREKHPDLVILDITMERMNGVDALAEIMAEDPDAHVIMCSALGDERTVVKCLELGAIDYVIKPFEKRELSRAIQDALDLE